jgi:hypothetical protein
VTLVTSAVSFIITIAVFLCVYLLKGLPLEYGIIVGVAVYVLVFIFGLADVKWQLHRIALGPLRKWLRFMLATIVIERWEVRIHIDSEGNAHLEHEFWGRVNFGFNKWITFGFLADSEQPPASEFPIAVTNVDCNREVTPEFIVDCPKYKRIKIPFEDELERGDKFHIKMEYDLSKTFFFGKKDYYTHHTFHNEKMIDVEVNFPDEVVVNNTWGRITTEHGDERGKHKAPEKKTSQFIKWVVSEAMHGDAHELFWETTLKGNRKARKLI